MDEKGFARGGLPALEYVAVDGEQGFGDRRRFGQRKAIRDRQALRSWRDAIFGIATARDQRADLGAAHGGIDAIAERYDVTGDLQAENRRRAWRGRVFALALEHVGPVHAGRGDLDQNLARPRFGDRPLDRNKHLRPAGLTRIDCQHRCEMSLHSPLGLDRSSTARAGRSQQRSAKPVTQ